jgi:NTP pyrophosphatase (non-canonical NTP hydrolase)
MATSEKTDLLRNMNRELEEERKKSRELDKLNKKLEDELRFTKMHVNMLKRELEAHVGAYKRKLDEMRNLKESTEKRLKMVKKELKNALLLVEHHPNN